MSPKGRNGNTNQIKSNAMKKALHITLSGAIITAIIGLTIMFTGGLAEQKIIIDFSVPFLLIAEVLCLVSIALQLIINRR